MPIARRLPLAVGGDRLPALAYRGRVFFRSAWQALRHGRTNMDVPISIGVLLAFGMSLYETSITAARLFRRGDLAAVLPADRPHARPRDARARPHRRQGLARLAPRGATVLQPDGSRAICRSRTSGRHDHPAGRGRSRAGRCRSSPDGRSSTLAGVGREPAAAGRAGRLLQAGTLNLGGPLTIEATRGRRTPSWPR
jgi:Cu2+-exporting ATPase